jgi:hypothetical protein
VKTGKAGVQAQVLDARLRGHDDEKFRMHPKTGRLCRLEKWRGFD